MSFTELKLESNTLYVLRKLRGFNLPFLRSTNKIQTHEFKAIEKELEQIELSIIDFKKQLSKQHQLFLDSIPD